MKRIDEANLPMELPMENIIPRKLPDLSTPKFRSVLSIGAKKFVMGSLNAMTGTIVSFLPVRIFTQQLLEKAKFKQPTPN